MKRYISSNPCLLLITTRYILSIRLFLANDSSCILACCNSMFTHHELFSTCEVTIVRLEKSIELHQTLCQRHLLITTFSTGPINFWSICIFHVNTFLMESPLANVANDCFSWVFLLIRDVTIACATLMILI